MKRPCVYILVNRPHGTFYVGVSSDLHDRMNKHTQGLFDGFTKKYGIKTLVYYEMHDAMEAAIRREKLLKRWNRAWKVRLVEQMNPDWRNLYDAATGEIAFGPADPPETAADRTFADTCPDPRLRGDDERREGAPPLPRRNAPATNAISSPAAHYASRVQNAKLMRPTPQP